MALCQFRLVRIVRLINHALSLLLLQFSVKHQGSRKIHVDLQCFQLNCEMKFRIFLKTKDDLEIIYQHLQICA